MLKHLPILCALSIFLIPIHLHAQKSLPLPTNIQKALNRNTRSTGGQPGAKYWQNKADYDLRISFTPATRIVAGQTAIDYYNNSPDTLTRVAFKLYPNLYQQEAIRSMPIAAADLTKGVAIRSMSINSQPVDSSSLVIRGTNMNLRKVKIMPGQKVHFDINYTYPLNEGSFVRTGQIDSTAFFLAYFFPRIAVYDDIDGWNDYPYTGPYEFYNDYGHFKAEISVPSQYMVWGTGDLINATEVYQPRYAALIETAQREDGILDIITAADLAKAGITRRPPSGTNTWRFEADNVTDIAFGISDHYVWKASSLIVDPTTKRRSRVDAVYNPVHTSYIPVIRYARKTTELISDTFPGIPFPYPHMTIFDGLDAMEYPMMVNDLPFEKQQDALEFTAHETFHTLFPFYVGTNETKYSFMDEGWATLAEYVLHPLIDSTIETGNNTADVDKAAGTEQDVPIMTLTPQLYGAARYADKDMKPSLGLFYIKEMLGDELFNKAVRYYISQWKGKHPTPFDFFACMNKGAGKDLNWFWYNWFFTKEVPDLAIAGVTHQKQQYIITISRNGNAIVPIHINIIYTDGSTDSLSSNIACWSAGNKSVDCRFTARKPIKQLILGAPFDADANKANNSWKP